MYRKRFGLTGHPMPKDAQGKAIMPPWLSGQEGEARVDVAKKPIAWVWTHRLIDFIRLKLWI